MPAPLDCEIAARICSMSQPELFTAGVTYGVCHFRWVHQYLGAGEIIIPLGRGSSHHKVDVDLAGQMFMTESCADELASLLLERLAITRLAA